MKCPHCKTNVTKIPVSWKCPHCSEQLPELGFWSRFFEGLSEYLVERGSIFWGIIFLFFLVLIGTMEAIFGIGFLIKYITKNLLISLAMVFFGGMLFDMYMKIVLPLQLPFGRGSFIIKERVIIRKIRKGSHLALLAGILTSLFWLGPRVFVTYFPAYILVISIFLGLAWAISGLFLDMRMAQDVRFRHYMDRLGVTSLKNLRKICTIIIAGLFVSLIVFFIEMKIPGLWLKINKWEFVGTIKFFLTTYLGFLF